MENAVNVIFLYLDKDLPLFQDVENHYKVPKDMEIWNVEGPMEVEQVLSDEGNGILIFKVSNKDELTAGISLLKKYKALNKKGLFRCICLLENDNPKIRKVLSKYGCSDVLEASVKSKTMIFKVDFWSRGFKKILEKQAKQANAADSAASKEKEQVKETKSDFEFVESLDLHSDMWLLRTKADCKRIIKKYLIKLIGPSSHAGYWEELESRPEDSYPSWRWNFHGELQDQFILDDGAWVFYGPKPEFDWKTHLWGFTGDTPHLYFYSDDKKVHSRVKYSNRQVAVAENSQYAIAKKDLIAETTDSNFKFSAEKSEEEETQNMEGQGHDNIANPALKGKGRTDNIDNGPMVGDNFEEDAIDWNPNAKKKNKNPDERDLYEEDLLAKSLKDQKKAGNLQGKSSTDQIDLDPMSGKNSREEDLGGTYGGKSKTDYIDSDPLEGKASEYEHERGPLRGKSSTDQVDHSPMAGKVDSERREDGPLSGKTSTDQVDTGPLRGKNSDEDELGGNYGGKSKTDYIACDPLEGKASEYEHEKGPLAGKSSTDQVDTGPMGGKTSAEDDLGGNYGGKSKTDYIACDPLEGKDSEYEHEKGPLAGKSSTDQVDRSPLGGKIDPERREDGPLSRKREQEQRDSDLQAASSNILRKRLSSTDDSGQPTGDVLPFKANRESSIEDALSENLTKDLFAPKEKSPKEKLDYLDKEPELNLESGTIKIFLKQKNKSGNEVTVNGEFEDLFDDELVAIAPKNSLFLEQETHIVMSLDYSGQKVSIECLAEIKEIDEYDEKREYIYLLLINVDQEQKDLFMQLYEQRQESIHNFMFSAKGF